MGMVQRPLVWGIGVFLIILIAVIVFAGVRQQTVFSEVVFVPEFANIKCDRLPNQLAFVDTTRDLTERESSYQCGAVDQYIPFGCEVDITRHALLAQADVFVCSATATSSTDGSCQKIGDFFLKNNVRAFPKYLEKVFIKQARFRFDSGDFRMKIRGEMYGLHHTANGYLELGPNCNLASLQTKYGDKIHGRDADDKLYGVLDPRRNEVLNYVLLQKAVRTNANQIITFKGKRIFVFAPGKYFKYSGKETADGIPYFDSEEEYADVALECVPGYLGCICTENACKYTGELVGRKCSGPVVDHVPVTATKECTYKCVDGKRVENDCRTRLQGDCDPLTQRYDKEKNACVGLTVLNTCEEGEHLVVAETKTPTWFGLGPYEVEKETRCEPDVSGWAKALPWVLSAFLVLLLLFVILKTTSGKQRMPQRRRR